MPSEGKNPKKHWFFPEETMFFFSFLLKVHDKRLSSNISCQKSKPQQKQHKTRKTPKHPKNMGVFLKNRIRALGFLLESVLRVI